MKTDFYEADAFTGSKGEHWASIDSDYRWGRGYKVWLEAKEKRANLRSTWLNCSLKEGVVTRDCIGLRLLL